MKWKYGISFLAFAIILSAAYYGSYQYTVSRYEKQKAEQELAEKAAMELEQVDAGSTALVNSDTTYILETYHIVSDTLEEEKIPVPSVMIGLTREELIQYLKDYEASPDASDAAEGLVSFSLVSFSKDEIILRKTYEADYMFYLCEEEGYVTVYYKDKETVFEHTGIPVSALPESIQEEIQSGKYLENNTELFSFLENYST